MNRWFRGKEDVGILLLRLFVGIRLLYGVVDNIVDWGRMKEFETFLSQNQFPFPFFSAIVSVYAQAIAGLLFLAGWQVRWAAILMSINFTVAIVMVHWGQSFDQMTTVLFMFFSSVVLLFTGAGAYRLGRE
jgi:putative oxidoreductase